MLKSLPFLFSSIFILLILYVGIFPILASIFKTKTIEGMKEKESKFKPYKKDPLQMATKNEENIKVLREEMDQLKALAEKAKQLKDAVNDNSKNIDALVQKEEAEAAAATTAANAISS